ncbi:carbon-nitrogen hydrolase family protein [Rhodopirellula sp.]|nr:carbon-nitrogen hydrolase family protein [Rhodopirellula sp.]MDB4678855.1 carbon-nitrogen hydrolase family protein [Rhodopirellula sp.]
MRTRVFQICRLFQIAVLSLLAGLTSGSELVIPDGWETTTPRDEIKPIFQWIPSHAGGSTTERFTIKADHRSGLSGAWVTTKPVKGGDWYRFRVNRRTTGMTLARRSAIARVIWLNKESKAVLRPDPTFTSYRPGERPRAEPEFPSQSGDSNQWTTLSGLYHAPADAVTARIELHFRWGEPNSSVHWSKPILEKSKPAAKRIARLAAIHYQPREGTTASDKREQFASLINQAAQQQADLVVLPETLTYYSSGKSFSDVAEAIPGPSSNYFGKLAKQHDLYIVAGLVERDQHLLYNVAVLMGPDGNLVGKYRKTTLPRGEIEAGLTPGDEYPVFETRFGKVGMMICYDGFFPEVARELSNRGAEVIAWPVWGCNPLLASARACENHIYLISSTYTESKRNWIRTAIYGHDGTPLAAADEFGTVVLTEVDLNRPTYWHSLGDFQSQIQPHRPRLNDPRP